MRKAHGRQAHHQQRLLPTPAPKYSSAPSENLSNTQSSTSFSKKVTSSFSEWGRLQPAHRFLRSSFAEAKPDILTAGRSSKILMFKQECAEIHASQLAILARRKAKREKRCLADQLLIQPRGPAWCRSAAARAQAAAAARRPWRPAATARARSSRAARRRRPRERERLRGEYTVVLLQQNFKPPSPFTPLIITTLALAAVLFYPVRGTVRASRGSCSVATAPRSPSLALRRSSAPPWNAAYTRARERPTPMPLMGAPWSRL